MTYDPEKHRRRSIRLRGYDYARAGAYFVTICAQDRQRLFGEIRDGEMHLNDATTTSTSSATTSRWLVSASIFSTTRRAGPKIERIHEQREVARKNN
jgi:hypothetical protein